MFKHQHCQRIPTGTPAITTIITEVDFLVSIASIDRLGSYGVPSNLGYGSYGDGYLGGYLTYPFTTTAPLYNTTYTMPFTTTLETTTTTVGLTAPTEAIIFRQEVAAARHARSDLQDEKTKKKKNVTVDVMAEQVIVNGRHSFTDLAHNSD